LSIEQWAVGKKKLSVSVAVPPSPVRVPTQKSLAPSVASDTLVANDKGDAKIILGSVIRSAGICLTVEENSRKPQQGYPGSPASSSSKSPFWNNFYLEMWSMTLPAIYWSPSKLYQ
jgi:hypothetical protein